MQICIHNEHLHDLHDFVYYVVVFMNDRRVCPSESWPSVRCSNTADGGSTKAPFLSIWGIGASLIMATTLPLVIALI